MIGTSQYCWFVPPKEHFPVMDMVKNNRIDEVVELIQQIPSLARYVWTNKRTTLLHKAAQKGQLRLVRTLTQVPNADVNVKDALGQDALFHACMNQKSEVVEYLVNETHANAKTRCIEWTALGIASAHGNDLICKMLIEKGANLFETMIGDININDADDNGTEKSALWWYRQFCRVGEEENRDGSEQLVLLYMGMEEFIHDGEKDEIRNELMTSHDAELTRCMQQKEKQMRPLSALLFSDTCSDVDIEVANQGVIPAHKCILASRSDIFATMFRSTTWLENNSSERKSRLNLATFSVDSVRTFLRYMYVSVVVDDELLVDLHGVLELASQYLMDDLKMECDRCIMNSIDTIQQQQQLDPEVLVNLLVATEHYNLPCFDHCKRIVMFRTDVLASKSLYDLREKHPELWTRLELTKRMRFSIPDSRPHSPITHPC